MTTVYVLKVEGNTDYFSDVLSVHKTKEGAEAAMLDAEAAARWEGEVVEGDNDVLAHIAWTRSFHVVPLPLED